MTLKLVARLVLPIVCSFAIPSLAQSEAPLLHCEDWSRATASVTVEDLNAEYDRVQKGYSNDAPPTVLETVKLPYLRGLQYGYLVALEDGYRFFRSESGEDPDKELPPTWGTLLFPRVGASWSDFIGAIDAFCNNSDHATNDVAEAVVTVLNEANARADRIGSDERSILFVGFGCAQYHEHPRAAFVDGYRDGQRLFWLLLKKAGVTDKIPAWKNYLTALNVHQFELPAGKELSTVIGDFCADTKNKNIPFVFAANIAAMQARGEDQDADPLLEHLYCSDLPTLWANGQQAKGKTCLGVIVFLVTKPVLEKPFSYMVGIINTSQTNIEVDWSQWTLSWKDKSKEEKRNPALDPDKVAHSIERRSTIAASLAAFGASMSANAPQKAVITGPQGTSTVTIYPQPGLATAAASQAAATTARPGMELASALSDSSLRRTTLFPGGETGGRMVYFAKPKGNGEASVQVHIPGLPTFSLEVNTK